MIYLGDRATVNDRVSNIMPVTPKRDKTHATLIRMTTVREIHRALRDSCSAYTVFMRLARIRSSFRDHRIISRFFSPVCNPQITDTDGTNRKRMVIGPQPESPTAVAIASRLTVHLAGLII